MSHRGTITKGLAMAYVYNDGGRAAAGFKGKTGDCVARALAIATGKPYAEVYKRLAEGNAGQKVTKHTRKTLAGKKTAAKGIYTHRKWFKDLMAEWGFRWVGLAKIGEPTKTKCRTEDLPKGRLVLSLKRHSAAFIEGYLQDTWDSGWNETAPVFGYWELVE